ncbi:unnamed protein product [Strongylus vulgaris]|uniref:Uncharacterized protein n=1 Tax=Strongylus vulgaris TaxID=40348 RepID=A0A3P7IT41_STRVU|nr:unnamed protein product [Strongylus vulgaris]
MEIVAGMIHPYGQVSRDWPRSALRNVRPPTRWMGVVSLVATNPPRLTFLDTDAIFSLLKRSRFHSFC